MSSQCSIGLSSRQFDNFHGIDDLETGISDETVDSPVKYGTHPSMEY